MRIVSEMNGHGFSARPAVWYLKNFLRARVGNG